MKRRVGIIGAGAAGVAAAFAAARSGAEVLVLSAGAGATALYSGALDADGADDPEVDPQLWAFGAALGVWVLPPRRCRVATSAGVVRSVRGLDVALLDLEPLAGAHIAVADVARSGWDAALLAHVLNGSRWAEQTGTTFRAVPVHLNSPVAPLPSSDYDWAREHDDPRQLEVLAQALRRAGTQHDGWLVGPWLGSEAETVERLREWLGSPVGEVTSPPGGVAGARFERAAGRLLEALSVGRRWARVLGVEVTARNVQIELGSSEKLDFDQVVLAPGGLVSGGVRLSAPSRPSARPGFELGFRADVDLELDGRDARLVASLHGFDFQTAGFGALARVGVPVERALVRGHSRLLAAGDVVASAPRTVLDAARSGIRAGREASILG